MVIHSTALIHPEAEIDPSVEIGPYVIIEKGVKIGPQNLIRSHACVCEGTTMGEGNEIHMGAIVGHAPQHLKYKGEKTFTIIGNRNIIREYVTIHRSFIEGKATRLGDENFLMATSHVAHDCQLGSEVAICNGSMLGGHITVDDGAFISGGVVIHQFVRIGRLAMISGNAGIGMDVPPFMLASGRSSVRGINSVGLRRAGVSAEVRKKIKWAYRVLYHQGLNVRQAVEVLSQENCAEVRELVEFIKNSRRGICHRFDRFGATSEETIVE